MTTEDRIRPTRSLPRWTKHPALLTIAGIGWLASTGAAVPENSSQIQLMVYSLGSALALIVAVRIAIRLFAYIVKTIVVLAAIGAVYAIAKLLADALGI
jgi:hypothetical protein